MAIPIEKKLKKKNLVLTYQLEGNAVWGFFLPDFEIVLFSFSLNQMIDELV